MDRANVDTDQIIPKQFLKRIERKGFGECLFFNWRFDKDGGRNRDFVLNQPKYAGASILVAGNNFGCGSSREHAPWALRDYGFKVIIAPGFADIFYNNCQKNGLLAIRLDKEKTDVLIAYAVKTSLHLTINLQEQLISGDGFSYTFAIDPYQKEMLVKGLDEIAVTMGYEDEIAAYERKHAMYA